MNRSIPATVLAVIIIVLAAGSGLAGDKEVVFDQSFAVKAGDELKVTVGDMNVLLKTGKSDEAHVEVTVTGNLDKMRERFEKMNFTAEIDDGALVLDTDDHHSWSISWWGSSGRGGVHLTVTLPEKFDLNVQTSDGDIDVTLSGKMAVDLSTSDGDITIRAPKNFGARIDLKGERVKLDGKVAIEGEVSNRRISGILGDGGPTLRARTSDGSVTLRFI